MKYSTCFLILLGLMSLISRAQTTFQEQAARLQDINAFLLDMRPGSAPLKAEQGQLVLSLDMTPQPDVDTRVGLKDEPVDAPSVVPRLRIRLESVSGLFVGGTYVPGLALKDYKADYYGLELGYRFRIKSVDAAVRVAYLDGDVTGPITEKAAEDFFVFENRGIDFSLGHRLRMFNLYGFVGYGGTDTELDIETDGVHLENSGEEAYGGLGLSWRRGPWELVLEQNITGDYLKHVVLSLSYRF